MNTYLIKIGTVLQEIRNIMNWSQVELSKKIGVSRPVLIKIQNDPSKMSKTIALAVFTATVGELLLKKQKIDNIDYSNWDIIEERIILIKEIIEAGINQKILTSFYVSCKSSPNTDTLKLEKDIRTLITLFSTPTLKSNRFRLTSSEVKHIINEALDFIESQLCIYFDMDQLDIVSFIKKIEEQE